MATYAFGDIQGCYDELRRLLDRLDFDPQHDKLWFAGDLVNRGPDSLKVLRFVKSLEDRAITVLGNHDLHLLALASGRVTRRDKGDLDDVLAAPDRDELLDWLRHRPLIHHDSHKGFSLIHAGLPPQWDLAIARACAGEVEAVLRGPDCAELLAAMYGNEPRHWSPGLKGMDRLRFIVNCFTRLRYCDRDGGLMLDEKAPLGQQSPLALPWFQVPERATRNERILFGHWSTLGYRAGDNVWALDSGCLWGGHLTAIRVRRKKPMVPVQLDCTGYADPGG
ncbi:symmetrical bis(5'-nucleosyl)-tetraphosphatase [Thioflavicoccus mobilis 8321]|uniref:Bis(5'-nucleosyl)-tetraphosphatase, symmetrical n=1 Tax=Thioflavicoccus mobilis 8321 TaxID=765912 RepID=L0H2Q8_9GAMM|nr:symmetrical bis(5'-nucleosyl)-tetraphosphatase [Thioflavicoccus mobilis]AGA91940.1 symmetrical bis(5'-nucleosyl)-tetraphosphatase [Thioflavicoccus mobilis 8321]